MVVLSVLELDFLLFLALTSEFVTVHSFECTDGCSIGDSYVNDNYCDCADCGDESDHTCETCLDGCPETCGEYMVCWSEFSCDDGCTIFESYLDDGMCDCKDCEDESEWTCDSCQNGCPNSCGEATICEEFVCNDGCVMTSKHANNGKCDCNDCSDEDLWNCEVCPGCPVDCAANGIICTGTPLTMSTTKDPTTTTKKPTTAKSTTTTKPMTTTKKPTTAKPTTTTKKPTTVESTDLTTTPEPTETQTAAELTSTELTTTRKQTTIEGMTTTKSESTDVVTTNSEKTATTGDLATTGVFAEESTTTSTEDLDQGSGGGNGVDLSWLPWLLLPVGVGGLLAAYCFGWRKNHSGDGEVHLHTTVAPTLELVTSVDACEVAGDSKKQTLGRDDSAELCEVRDALRRVDKAKRDDRDSQFGQMLSNINVGNALMQEDVFEEVVGVVALANAKSTDGVEYEREWEDEDESDEEHVTADGMYKEKDGEDSEEVVISVQTLGERRGTNEAMEGAIG